VESIQQTVSDLTDLDKTTLNVLCHSGILPNQNRPKVIAFDLDDDTLELLPQVLLYKGSNVFLEIWNKMVNAVADQKGIKLAIKETLKEVWSPVNRNWNALCQQMQDGKMLFQVLFVLEFNNNHSEIMI